MNTHGMITTTHADGTKTYQSFAARQKEITRAVAKYARKHGYFASTVRTVTVLWKAALVESGI